MKKFASLFLALALCMGLAIPAFAAEYGSVGIDTGPAVVTFDAAIIGEDTMVTFADTEGNKTDQVCTPITLKPGSHVKADLDGGAAMYHLYEVDAAGVLHATGSADYFYPGSVDSYFSPESSNSVKIVIGGEGKKYLLKLGDGATAPTEPTVPNFTDVAAGAYYADAVNWAVDKKITTGTSTTTFSPNNTCTTAQILTFLWRVNGSPAPAGSNAAVPAGQYYTDAANWALEKGLTDAFIPDAPATRAATVTYLWKLAGKPAADAAAFADVDAGAEYAQAVAWAVKEGITTGTSTTTFDPDSTCTRGQIVTFLHRSLA